jgi:acyl-ACP thioesterase
MGAFVDKVAGKLKRVDDATIASMTLEPKLEMNYKDRRIILPKIDGEVQEPIRVLRADIDYNKHLNNANYVRMAMELLPENFVVNGLRVEYRVAAKLGEMLVPTIYRHDNVIIISLSISEDISAIIEFSSYF